jgi:hypothetical protein
MMMAILPSILSEVNQQRSGEHNTCPRTLNFDAQVSCFWLFHSADTLCNLVKRVFIDFSSSVGIAAVTPMQSL